MKLLLDTAVVLWITYDAPKLSAIAKAAYADPDNEVYVSVASLWEIVVKALGKAAASDIGQSDSRAAQALACRQNTATN